MHNSVSGVTDAEIRDEAAEALTQAAFDAADEASAAEAVEAATESLPGFDELGLSDELLRAVEFRPAPSPRSWPAATCSPPPRPAPARRPPSCCPP